MSTNNVPITSANTEKRILDSGNRRSFESGAVRDIADGKGRMDLLPLEVVSDVYRYRDTQYAFSSDDSMFTPHFVYRKIDQFMDTGNLEHIYQVIVCFAEQQYGSLETAFLELSIHYEQGAKKYAERNWEKGISCHCYIDSALRHYTKLLRKDADEPHDRAFLWNLMCLLWTIKNRLSCNDLPFNQTEYQPRYLQNLTMTVSYDSEGRHVDR